MSANAKKLPISIRSWASGILVALVICCVDAEVGRGQTSPRYGRDESKQIRRTAKNILSSPEFRHFRRLERGANTNGSTGSNGMPSSGRGSGGNGNSRSRNGSSPSESKADGRTDNAPADGNSGDMPNGSPENAPDTSPGQDAASSSFGGALASGLGLLFHMMAWLLLAVVVGFFIFLIVKAIQNYESTNRPSELIGDTNLQGDMKPERAPGELPADAYLAESRKLAAAGKFREAVAQLLLGAMSVIERAGLIRYRRGLTHHDYLRSVRSEQDLHEAMRAMVLMYEPLGFGRRTPAAKHYERSLSQYETAFRAPPIGERPK
jgi:hypothetical protein